MYDGFLIAVLLVPVVSTTNYHNFGTDIDYYQVLNVTRSAKVSTIRTAYRKLALRLHPDTSGCDTTKQFQILGEAKNILTDKKERVVYNMFHPEAGYWSEAYDWDMADCEMRNASLVQKVHRKATDVLRGCIQILKDHWRIQIPSMTSYIDLYKTILTDYFVIGVLLVSSATLWCSDLIGQFISAVGCAFYGLHLLTVAYSSSHLFVMEIIKKLFFHLFHGPSLRASVLKNNYILNCYLYMLLSLVAVALVFHYYRPRHVTQISNVLWTMITVVGCVTILAGLPSTEMYLDFRSQSEYSSIYTLILCGLILYVLRS
ncbi:uncharacterized protein LOC117314802 [Pecten maximus]|uniref:uncharacterized protein LOC117314802 n=1 Tax=Pecten maximus TaxID=6579 RepID=UPI001458B323|nr:uncharacterized protein LOC117314802 [Pecten maximus]